jgi:hypothetical protein
MKRVKVTFYATAEPGSPWDLADDLVAAVREELDDWLMALEPEELSVERVDGAV